MTAIEHEEAAAAGSNSGSSVPPPSAPAHVAHIGIYLLRVRNANVSLAGGIEPFEVAEDPRQREQNAASHARRAAAESTEMADRQSFDYDPAGGAAGYWRAQADRIEARGPNAGAIDLTLFPAYLINNEVLSAVSIFVSGNTVRSTVQGDVFGISFNNEFSLEIGNYCPFFSWQAFFYSSIIVHSNTFDIRSSMYDPYAVPVPTAGSTTAPGWAPPPTTYSRHTFGTYLFLLDNFKTLHDGVASSPNSREYLSATLLAASSHVVVTDNSVKVHSALHPRRRSAVACRVGEEGAPPPRVGSVVEMQMIARAVSISLMRGRRGPHRPPLRVSRRAALDCAEGWICRQRQHDQREPC